MSVGERWLRLTSWVALVAALALFAHHMAGWGPSYYGTARAPHSDSLTSWVQGTLDFYFSGGSSAVLLFRPTVPVLYSSLLTAFGDLGAIPLFFIAAIAAAAALAFAMADLRGRLALLALLAALMVLDRSVLDLISINSLNTELPGFALGLAGLLLIGAGLARASEHGGAGAPFYPGWLLLGIVAAIRGTLLAAFPALLLFSWWILRRTRAAHPGRAVALAAAGFALPYAIDIVLQQAFGVRNPALMPLFAFYWDPTHTLTNDAYFAFTSQNPSGSEVLGRYLAFVFSPAGIGTIAEVLAHRLGRDGAFLGQVSFAAVASLTAVGGVLPLAGRRSGAVPAVIAARLGALALVWALALAGGGPHQAVLMGTLMLLTLAVAVAWSLPFAGLFALGYLGGAIFLVLTGTAAYDRILSSFVFCPYAAVLWLLVEPGASGEPSPEAPAPLMVERLGALAAAAAAAALYLVNPLVDTPLKRLYAERVAGRPMAMKVSQDAGLDRSLYYGGGTELLYTRADDRPIGTVRPLAAFANPTGQQGEGGQISGARLANALFENPGRFDEPAGP